MKTKETMKREAYDRAFKEHLVIEVISKNEYLVRNLNYGTTHTVEVQDGYVINCSCPHHIYRVTICKHMVAVAISKQFAIE